MNNNNPKYLYNFELHNMTMKQNKRFKNTINEIRWRKNKTNSIKRKI